ncbi:Hypothetical protein EHI5A_216880 [Entamoeba histolytica KU27]|uniref:Capsid protein n=1 Tax=Entamoeba histolytica KU27 TaxID=885311 RepID=M2R8P9_ENTHI|nr:Hypothetical protein EHI5A_216880 [Entamoeba histolytica KU27]
MARLKRRTTRRKTSKRPTVRRGRRVYKRRVYRKRRRYYRRRRLLSQPNTIKLKNKLVCSIVEFQTLPQRDNLPKILCMANFETLAGNKVSNVTEENKAVFSTLGQMFFNIQSVDTANSILPTEQHGRYPPSFIAWNPWIDADLLGNLWNSYNTMYEYWKFTGVKVKWIPKVKTSVAIPYPPYGYIDNNRVTTGTWNASTGGVNLTTKNQDTSYARILTKSDDTGLEYHPQVTFNMHVLFEKDNYESYPLPTNPNSVDETLMCKDTRYKYKTFDYGPTKPKTYKVYDMTKPFKFYVKPYLQTTMSEITNDLIQPQTGLTTATQTKTLDTQINKKKRMNYVKFGGTTTVPYSTPSTVTNADMYKVSIQDSYYFDPILFGYFFTVNGIAVGDKLTIATPKTPIGESTSWNGYSLFTSPVISGMGHFELTFYTKFKQLKNK